MQITLWPANEKALKEEVQKGTGLISITKLANWAIATYIQSKKPVEWIKIKKKP